MFPKSKRFADKGNKFTYLFDLTLSLDSGIPPVGSYEVKNSASGVSHSFIKSQRFRTPSDSGLSLHQCYTFTIYVLSQTPSVMFQ